LADLGDDPNLDLWIADTIPQMIEPGSWKTADGKSKLSYYAPGKVLVINQTPAVHAKVSAFLNDLKQSLAKTSARIDPQVRPVQFTAPVSNAARPKHLFHFIIRNESDGGGDPSLSWLGRLPLPVFVNQYSSDPMARMENMLIESENLRQIHEEWRRFWMNDQPSHLTPYRIHGGVGPASSPISAPPCPPVTGGSPPRSAAPPTIIAQ
jgi:hypothetical protein